MSNEATKLLVAKRDEAIMRQKLLVEKATKTLEAAKVSESQFIDSMNTAIRAVCDHSDGRRVDDRTTWDYHNNVERGSIYSVCVTCGHSIET